MRYTWASLLFSLVVVALVSRHVTGSLEVIDTGAAEYHYTAAAAVCAKRTETEPWRLPGVIELLGIFYFRDDVQLRPGTDYWSRLAIGGYAFGLNSHLGILSFDRQDDIDHVLCVR